MPKDTLAATYYNAKQLADALEEIGYRGIQTLDIWDLAAQGTAGDRETFHIEGNTIIVAPRAKIIALGDWNNAMNFGISFNSEGQDEDDWIEFSSTMSPNYIWFWKLEHLMFYKFTVRSGDVADWVNKRARIYILQDPAFVVQLNKLLKDIIT